MIVDLLKNWATYPFGDAWKRSFEFLISIRNNINIEEKTYYLQGEDIFARVMSYETRLPENAVLEAHRKYVDIQTTLINSEGIEWFPTDSLSIKSTYNDEKDAEFYIRPTNCPARIDVYPGTFVALFPNDAHMPQLIVNNSPSLVKKIVVKMNKSLLKYI